MNALAKVIDMEERRQSAPQLEDGYIRIANELFDAFLSFKFSLRQSKVFLAIMRKTYGYGKKSDDVSASQLGALCAMPRPHVASTLVELERMSVITRSPGKYGTVTAINKDYMQWMALGDNGSDAISGAKKVGESPKKTQASRSSHYIYRIDNDTTGEFYVGVRSCDCHPNQDRYIGSGCWTATQRKSELRKTVLSIHGTRQEAEHEEARVIRSMSGSAGMKNVVLYGSGAPSTESERELVQNLNSSAVQKLYTQKTTFQKTTSKDNLKREKRKPAAQDLPAAPDWMPVKEWADFIEHRKQIKHPLTDLSAKRLISKIEALKAAGHSPAKLLDLAIINGWRDVFERKETLASAPNAGGPEINPVTGARKCGGIWVI